jgi:acetate kinase
MEKNILVINIGSSSKKYSLYRGGTLLINAHFEKNKKEFEVTYSGQEVQGISQNVFRDSLSAFYNAIQKEKFLTKENPLSAIGIRLVAPGEYFSQDRVVEDSFLEKLKVVAGEDPTHIEPIQKELTRAKELFGNVPVVAVSDSAFHTTLPIEAKNYAIPKALVEEFGVRRFGYHGISLSNIVSTLTTRPLGLERKVIICHLGSGASVTAVLDGKSIDTSMGYSPLEGLVMSSRVGNIDVGAVLHMVEKTGVKELEELLYTKSGLLALSGLSDDMRVLIDAEKEGHKGAHLAIETFAYTIRKYIGMYTAVLGGVDLIVFSGTIGERSFILRDRICSNLGWLNVYLDNDKNTYAKSRDYIGREGSLGVCVMHSDEDFEIMKKTEVLLQ